MTTEIYREIYVIHLDEYTADFAGAVWAAVNQARAVYPGSGLVRVSVLPQDESDKARNEVRIQVTMKRERV